jgi:2-polyprenyl-3-methyl-5-hydroxy-6-metoxy-1,4-benzoquinol methylase
MPIRQDPEGNEEKALMDCADLDGARVLEVGCGDGRLTWRYAHLAEHVVAIDPFEPSISAARRDLPRELASRISLHATTFDDYVSAAAPASFDIVLLSWSLC